LNLDVCYLKHTKILEECNLFGIFVEIEDHNLLQTHLDLAYICFKVVSNIYQLSIML
jgi:hypothetical protein